MQRRPRRYDPERRDRIIRAAQQVIFRDGIEALTHRAVAAVADVPLSSTTYHFADKEELLSAVLALSAERGESLFPEMFAAHRPEENLPRALANFLEDLTTREREQLILDYEIFLGARRRPALREAALRWTTSSYRMIEPYTDPETARLLTDLLEGFLAQHVVFGRDLRAKDVEPEFARVLNSARP
ncbi:MAG TPA: TetR family transcriptional regulator [Pseudolysinimonas sp.]|nr:TetR family transcriptional regulator [Pseudolysinimonas sp.]